MRLLGVMAGFLLLAALVYGAYYFSPSQRENRAIKRAILERQALEEKERSAGIYRNDNGVI